LKKFRFWLVDCMHGDAADKSIYMHWDSCIHGKAPRGLLDVSTLSMPPAFMIHSDMYMYVRIYARPNIAYR